MQHNQKMDTGAGRTAAPASMAPPADHTVATLLALYGAAARGDVAAFLFGTPDADVVLAGAHVSAERIVPDGVRIVGEVTDFVATATPAQRELVEYVITAPFLSAAITSVSHAATMGDRLSRRRAARTARVRVQRDTADTQLTKARARRTIYQKAIIAQSGGSAAWRTRIDNACGQAETLGEMAASIDKLATEGRALAVDVKAKGGHASLQDRYFKAMNAYATELRDLSGETEGLASKRGLFKGDLDWWKGASLWFIKTMASAFNAAHEADPTIPRISFGSLQSFMKQRAKSPSRERVTPAPTPTPTPARPA